MEFLDKEAVILVEELFPEWRQLECWPELKRVEEMYYERLPLLEKIIWKIKRKIKRRCVLDILETDIIQDSEFVDELQITKVVMWFVMMCASATPDADKE